MSASWKDLLEEALEPLTWGFEQGDDGGVITLALDEAASLFARRLGVDADEASSLFDVLVDFEVLTEAEAHVIEELYDLAGSHNYGAGFTEPDAQGATEIADKVSNLVKRAAEKVHSAEPSE